MPDPWLTRGARSIGLASLLSDLGHEVPTALLPSFLTTTLGAPAAALGAIEGVADGLAGGARLAGGALADDPERRRATAVGGYTATAVLSSLIGLATAVWQVGALRAGAWIARGLRVPSRNALLADVVPAEAYGRAYGYERAMDNVGAILGPLLALGLVAAVGVRWAIALSVIPGLLAAVAIVAAVRAAPRLEPRVRAPLRLRVRPVVRGPLGGLLLGIAAFELANVAGTLLILRATGLLDSERWALALYAGCNLAAAAAAIPAGRLSDRRGSVLVLGLAAAAFLGAFAGLAVAGGSVALLAVLFALAGAGKGIGETAQSHAVAALAPAALRGSAFGVVSGVAAFANLAASVVAGALWTAVSPRAAFLWLAGCAAAALVAFAAAARSPGARPGR